MSTDIGRTTTTTFNRRCLNLSTVSLMEGFIGWFETCKICFMVLVCWLHRCAEAISLKWVLPCMFDPVTDIAGSTFYDTKKTALCNNLS